MPKRKILLLATAIMLCLSCTRQEDHRELYQELKSADKMIFASMSITKTATIDKSREFFGKRIAVYSYDTYMHAYIDMSALSEDDISFDDKARTVHITLPPIVTEISGRDMELRKEYDNIGLFRDSIDARERAELKELANTSLKKELQENKAFTSQLTDAAKHKARQYFESLFGEKGYSAVIDFKSL